MISEEKIELVQLVTYPLIFVTLIIFGYGWAHHNQIVTLAGMFSLGIVLTVHAPLSLMTITRRRNAAGKISFALCGEYFFALGQLLFGILMFAGAIADVTTNYISSGKFWQQVAQYPYLFFFCFGAFCSLVGISQIAASLKPEGEEFSDKLHSFKDILQGIIFLIFGLIFIGLIIFAKLL